MAYIIYKQYTIVAKFPFAKIISPFLCPNTNVPGIEPPRIIYLGEFLLYNALLYGYSFIFRHSLPVSPFTFIIFLPIVTYL